MVGNKGKGVGIRMVADSCTRVWVEYRMVEVVGKRNWGYFLFLIFHLALDEHAQVCQQ